jgi:hypothetical protein
MNTTVSTITSTSSTMKCQDEQQPLDQPEPAARRFVESAFESHRMCVDAGTVGASELDVFAADSRSTPTPEAPPTTKADQPGDQRPMPTPSRQPVFTPAEASTLPPADPSAFITTTDHRPVVRPPTSAGRSPRPKRPDGAALRRLLVVGRPLCSGSPAKDEADPLDLCLPDA